MHVQNYLYACINFPTLYFEEIKYILLLTIV